MIVSWVLFVIILILFLFIVSLICFHLYLIKHNLTTLEYLISKKEEQIHDNLSVTKIKQLNMEIIKQKPS